jgi:Lon protease-like protein
VNKVVTSISKFIVGPFLITVQTTFPAEYMERQRAIERDARDARLDTPIFVCALAFPGMPTILHVFEPRYRLMIRRCIESSVPQFGMVMPARGTGDPHLQGMIEYGTLLEIQSVQMLPDGRSMVETIGISRFKVLEKGSLDGYTVGRIERYVV